jgi:membrane protein implicated in regulation of membrane protease activity
VATVGTLFSLPAIILIGDKMSGRLLVAIISTVAEEAAVLILGIWLLPEIGVHLPFLIILAIMFVWLIWSIFTYRKGTYALLRKPFLGMVNMIGNTGIVVKTLDPDGLAKFRGELWSCTAQTGYIENGTRVIVIKQDGLKLVVRPEPDVSGKESIAQ